MICARYTTTRSCRTIWLGVTLEIRSAVGDVAVLVAEQVNQAFGSICRDSEVLQCAVCVARAGRRENSLPRKFVVLLVRGRTERSGVVSWDWYGGGVGAMSVREPRVRWMMGV